MYCKGAGAAAEYCMGAEECVVGSTTPVRRGGLSYRGDARGSVLQGSRGHSRVLYGSGGVCGGVHNTRPSGGAELQGRGPRNPTVGRDPSVQGDDQLQLSLRQRSRQPFAEI